MTYILVNKSKESRIEQLSLTLSKIFNKNFTEKEILNSPDIHILNPEGENSIGIEEIKEFQIEMRYRPFEEEIQVGIILDSQKLTHQAQNALLKTLEETTKYTIYILSVDNERNLLATIRSRGRVIYTGNKKEEIDDGEESENILNADLFNQFLILEKYSSDKDSSLQLISSIEEFYKRKLDLDIKNGNIDSSKKVTAVLNILQSSREKILANCNRRLVLESMILQINA
ncbi:MAG: hypothetical protein AB9915_03615 [Candidatus Dojkabacteria bacterium]